MAEFIAKWPPFELPEQGATAPMFPLRNVYLFPRQVLPLHVFEPRYRTMVEDLLDGPGRLVIATALEAERHGRPPRVLPVGGLGEIMRHQRLEDGRFLIWLLGLGRCELEEIDSPHPYRLVRYRPMIEIDVPDEQARVLAESLRSAIEERLGQELDLPGDAGVELLTDVLMQTMQPPPPEMARIFAEEHIAERARLALRESGFEVD